jgi:hypothetical protein
MEDHVITQTSEQCLLVLLRSYGCRPERRQLLPDSREGRLGLSRQGHGDDRGVLVWREGIFCVCALAQGSFPPGFQCGGDQAVIGIHAAERPLRQGGMVPQPLQFWLVRRVHVPAGLLRCCERLGLDVELEGCEGLGKGLNHVGIDGISWEVLTDRAAILVPEVGAQGARGVLILDQPCVATRAAVDEPG